MKIKESLSHKDQKRKGNRAKGSCEMLQCIGITFHTNRKSPSFLPRFLQELFYNIVHASSIFAQSLKVLQSFDKAGDFQKWCEKCGLGPIRKEYDYILGLTNQLKFVTTIIVHGTNHSITERKLEQNSVIQTVYNCKAMNLSPIQHVVQFPTATPAATDSSVVHLSILDDGPVGLVHS